MNFIFLLMFMKSLNLSIEIFIGPSTLEIALSKAPHAVVGYFDSLREPASKTKMINFLKKMKKEEVLIRDEFKFYALDMRNSSLYRDVYNITSSMALIYSVNSHIHKFRVFEKMADLHLKGKLSEKLMFTKTMEFITHKLGKLRSKINTLEEFEKKLQKHKLLAVFLGNRNSPNEEHIYRLAMTHQVGRIYRIFNNTLSRQVYQKHANHELGESEKFCFFRHESTIDDVNFHPIKCIKASAKFHKYDVFYHAERHHKLMTHLHTRQMYSRYLGYNHQILIYLYNGMSSSDHLEEFKKAVRRLPNHFGYAAINVDLNEDKETIETLFSTDAATVEIDSVYICYENYRTREVIKMEETINEKAVEKFLITFFLENQRLYKSYQEKVIRAEMKGIIEQYEYLLDNKEL